VQTQADERAPVVSPDDRWLAYLSDESGRYELYVVGLSPPGPPRQLSSGGATEPAWAKDGSKLYYRTGRSVMQVAFRAGSAVGASARVFEGPFDPDPFFNANYDLAADGRLLMVESPRMPEAEIRFVFGFSHELAGKFRAIR
jgi:Tol biopolymer transport system component